LNVTQLNTLKTASSMFLQHQFKTPCQYLEYSNFFKVTVTKPTLGTRRRPQNRSISGSVTRDDCAWLLQWSSSLHQRTPASQLRGTSQDTAVAPAASTPFLAVGRETGATGYRSRGSQGTHLLRAPEEHGQGVKLGNCFCDGACGDMVTGWR
jgi:hypothetical protein